MKLQLKNMIYLFKNIRTRSIIIVTGCILLFGFLYGFMHLTNKKPPVENTSIQLKETPDIDSIPGGLKKPPSTDYQRLQAQQNLEQAARAEKTGASVIPTLLDSNQFHDEENSLQMNCCPKMNNACSPTSCDNGAKVSCENTLFSMNGPLSFLQPSQLKSGTLIYDMQGKVIGHLGADGKVRDESGQRIGEVGPDGLVRRAEGDVIGSAAVPARGDSVYDATGRLIGTVGWEGKVRDPKGHLIGMVGPDGIVRDAQHNVVGKAGVNRVGAPIYDTEGHRLGTIDAEGRLSDASGKVLGDVDSNGVVRNSSNDIIGHADLRGIHEKRQAIPGAPVYDHQGRLIGTLNSDDDVRDEHGNVIGQLDKEGLIRGLEGKIIGKLGATAPGAPVYDRQGRLVGTVSSDGIVRDVQGKALGKLSSDGMIRDAQGKVLGSIAAFHPKNLELGTSNEPTPATVRLLPDTISHSSNPELQRVLERQAQQISAQKADQLQEQMQTAMSTQASQLFTAWASPNQRYVTGIPDVDRIKDGLNTPLAEKGDTKPPAVKAGTILYAILLTAVNSDEPGPVLAEIVQGKFKGARLMGTLSNQGQKILLSFNTLTLPHLSKSVAINTVAIDENTARTALSSDTNNHYWLRYGTLFASAFLQGYGQSFLDYGNNYSGAVVINPSNQPIDLSPRQRVFVGLGQVGEQYASALRNVFNTPPTVKIYSGTPMGILFLSDLSALPN
ncbi:hypothetical protein BEV13_05605 [Rickettsiella grylli]|uniref:TrbI/VirB10 family protein n=1 Tax=Rickettsiella grylli TaxID=59196 RepID=UPI0008FD6750|nr:TrbI/VirB10 family protein [Rickettsiella grylli]OIZ99541.1 hypothetical protein BEV13_05605 [Rickettsiella grylli]